MRVVFILKITPGVPPSFFLKEVTASYSTLSRIVVTSDQDFDILESIQTSKIFVTFCNFFGMQISGLSLGMP